VINYFDAIRSSKFCLSPYGHGWGIRTTLYMAHGCVPVILQDHVYQVGAVACEAECVAVYAHMLQLHMHCHFSQVCVPGNRGGHDAEGLLQHNYHWGWPSPVSGLGRTYELQRASVMPQIHVHAEPHVNRCTSNLQHAHWCRCTVPQGHS
jgi:hypothetical protein